MQLIITKSGFTPSLSSENRLVDGLSVLCVDEVRADLVGGRMGRRCANFFHIFKVLKFP